MKGFQELDRSGLCSSGRRFLVSFFVRLAFFGWNGLRAGQGLAFGTVIDILGSLHFDPCASLFLYYLHYLLGFDMPYDRLSGLMHTVRSHVKCSS